MKTSKPTAHLSQTSPLLIFLRVFFFAVVITLTGCTDGATRLAFEIRDAAKRLSQSTETSLEIKHRPRSSPDGVKGRYEIRLQASLHRPGGSLLVSDLDSRGHKLHGYNWSTTYHLNFVRVPRELSIRKQAGETTVVVLERHPDGAIEVTALR